MALPLGTVKSLRLTFVLVRWVDLVVKLLVTFAFEGQSSFGLRKTLYASVTLWKAYAS